MLVGLASHGAGGTLFESVVITSIEPRVMSMPTGAFTSLKLDEFNVFGSYIHV